MDRCPSCGGGLTTGGCINSDCVASMGGTYLDGKKIATASGRRLHCHTGHCFPWPNEQRCQCTCPACK